jgi:fumarate hydratase class II
MKNRSDNNIRMEEDSLGVVALPASALFGAQTQRAIENFPISNLRLPFPFLQALALIKQAAASANQKLGKLAAAKAERIINAALQIIAGEHTEQFPIDVFQTGSGTSTNMNMNEVLAHLSDTAANDEVNMSQSSNDVIPSAIHISTAMLSTQQLLPALEHLLQQIQHRITSIGHQVKSGRTHLMDAMPLTWGQELSGWQQQLRNQQQRLQQSLPELLELAIGGTAVGTGINAPANFANLVCQDLQARTNLAFKPKTNYFEALSCQDAIVSFSGTLRSLAVSLLKISNDLRWMNSGPLAGLAEISLPALQPGSSIMPGKVNPVIPEAVAMVCAQVFGNDATIAFAGQSGNFQLNVMLPVIAYNILQSTQLLSNAMRLLADKAIAGFCINQQHIEINLARNPVLITALNQRIGYQLGAKIAKRAYAEKRAILDVALEMTDLDRATLEQLLDPKRCCFPE